MKKLIFLAVVLSVLVSCTRSKNEKAHENYPRIADSYPQIADSIANEEIPQNDIAKTQAIAEEARLESIRQDSIKQEKKMRLSPKVFEDYFNEKKMKKRLKALGFKLIKEEREDFDEFEGYWAEYKRTLNGRTIKIEYGYATSNEGSIEFSDKEDLEQFKKDLSSSGFKKMEYGYYENYSGNYPSFEIQEKNLITFGYY